MTVHVTQNGKDQICENELGPKDSLISLEEALDPDGIHFDCVDCHKKLTGGRRHSL